jgi:hypothetical protein
LGYGTGGNGKVIVYSLDSGEVVYEIEGEPGDWLGYSLETIGDVDHDGALDFACGCPRGNGPGIAASEERGVVKVISGKSGGLLYEVSGAVPGDCFSCSLTALKDVTGDGTPDFAVGAPDNKPEWNKSAGGDGYVCIFSGIDGSLIYRIGMGQAAFYEALERPPKPTQDVPSFNAMFGYSLAGGLDVDSDDVGDIAVGAIHEGVLAGSVRLYSGRTGKLIRESLSDGFHDWGRSVFFVNDVNRDGRVDYGCSAVNDTHGALPIGAVLVFSGATGDVLYTLRSPLAPKD